MGPVMPVRARTVAFSQRSLATKRTVTPGWATRTRQSSMPEYPEAPTMPISYLCIEGAYLYGRAPGGASHVCGPLGELDGWWPLAYREQVMARTFRGGSPLRRTAPGRCAPPGA